MRVSVTMLGAGAIGDDPRDGWDPAPLFARAFYTRHLGPCEVIEAIGGDAVVARLIAPVRSSGGGSRIARANFLCPYFPILFRRDAGGPVRVEQRRRAAVRAIVESIRARHDAMVLPLHPDITDMIPFQQANMQLERRTTYELPLADLDALWRGFDPAIRNHVRSAGGLDFAIEAALGAFDLDAALFYEEAPDRAAWRALVATLLDRGHARTIVARAGGRPVGGLLLAQDARAGYNLLSYFDRDCGLRGVPSALIWAAAREAARQGLERLDLEGSVLSGVERFYQRFGGVRRPYYQVHWQRDARERRPIVYDYEPGHGHASCD